jgi:glyceraldehyde 3-phosphate dehydrogenase
LLTAVKNIILSFSGAAKALPAIWPELKVTVQAYRVPARTGSIEELNVIIQKLVSADELRDLFRQAAASSSLTSIWLTRIIILLPLMSAD